MKVSLKTRARDKRTDFLLLDIYTEEGRTRKATGFWRYRHPRNAEEKAHNEDANTKAAMIRAKAEANILEGKKAPTAPKKPAAVTIEGLTQLYIDEKQVKPNTAKTFLQMLGHINGKAKTNKLNAESLQAFADQIRRANIKENSKLLYYTKFVAVAKFGAKKGYFSADALQGIEGRPKKEDTERVELTKEELFLMVADYQASGKNWMRVFLFSCFTGLRYSDIKALSWAKPKAPNMVPNYAYIEGDTIKVKMQKTATPLALPLSENAKSLLPANNGKEVFQVPDTSSLRKNLLKWAQSKTENPALMAKALSFHTARHTFAMLALNDAKLPLYTVSKLLGHKSIATTQIYAKPSMKAKAEAVAALDAVLNDKRQTQLF